MRQTQNFGTLCMLIVLAAPAAAAAQGQGSCQQIRAACQSAGFAQGAAKLGIGLQVDCIIPIMSGTGQRPRARLPLPQVNPKLVAECATSHPRFGRQNAPPTEPISQPLREPGLSYPNDPAQVNGPGPGVLPPVLEGTLRPPMQSAREQRDVVSALPPEEQPETGPVKLSPQFRRTEIAYQTKEPTGTIIIDTSHTYLYLVLSSGKAMRYGIGVGREGFTWAGTERISRASEWPDWHPPPEMIERQPYLPRFMAGGESNPLGARALYLGNTLYRIHGTNQPSTIGTFVSSGCIRLTNEDVTDLYGRVQVGTRVVVLPGKPS
jgi:lipoprotein-anchoring transpeptidase ErfK/SrfK